MAPLKCPWSSKKSDLQCMRERRWEGRKQGPPIPGNLVGGFHWLGLQFAGPDLHWAWRSGDCSQPLVPSLSLESAERRTKASEIQRVQNIDWHGCAATVGFRLLLDASAKKAAPWPSSPLITLEPSRPASPHRNAGGFRFTLSSPSP